MKPGFGGLIQGQIYNPNGQLISNWFSNAKNPKLPEDLSGKAELPLEGGFPEDLMIDPDGGKMTYTATLSNGLLVAMPVQRRDNGMFF